MSEFRQKQRRFKRLRNISAVILAIIIFIYIGVEPMLLKAFGSVGIFQLILFALVIFVLVIVFIYESKYEKAGKYLDGIDLQISDAGYYLTSRKENEADSYYNAVLKNIIEAGYKICENYEADSFLFDCCALKSQEYIYAVKLNTVDKNDVIAYLDAARNDITGVKLKRKGETVVVFFCDESEESAVELSKNTVTVVTSRYNSLSFSPVIVEVKTGRVYFLGNKISRTQKIVANYIMNCDLPFKEEYISKEKLAFQNKLENEIKEFNVSDFKSGKYNVR